MIARYALAAAAALAVMSWLSLRSAYIHKGETRAVAKIERANDKLRQKAAAVTRKSADPDAGGVLNKYYRD